MSAITEKVKNLLSQINKICGNAEMKQVSVLAATKYASVNQMQEAIDAGIKVIGENKIQDAKKKLPLLNRTVEKHFIGHLQKNKVRDAVILFDFIESVDSVDLARMIDEKASENNKIMPVFLEINIGKDTNKHGFEAVQIDDVLGKISALKHIKICGFMTILPNSITSEQQRAYFKQMKALFDRYRTKLPSLNVLSMGMSSDYLMAIEEGATEVRVGSLFFLA